MAYAFWSERVVTAGGVEAAAVVVEGGLIRAVCRREEVPAGVAVRDLGRMALLPGLVDTHVHLNEPGRTEWEGFATGTRAAAAGGYTTVVDMPLNCLPETTNVAALAAKRAAAAGKCTTDWAAWGGAVDGNQEELVPLARAGVRGFKCFLIYPGCDGFGMIGREELERALPAIVETGLPLLVHAELAGPIFAAEEALRAAGADWRRYATYLASRPDEAELAAIRMLLELCREYRFRLHIVHLSSALTLPRLRAAKAEGLPVTVETCPHYLYFAAEEVADGNTLLKCAPPIRGRANREALWGGLRDGTIDLIATDHSPCPPEMKGLEAGRFDAAWGGIASLSVAVSAVWTEARRRGFSLEDLARWMASGPALLAGLEGCAGAIAAGREANFAVFDAEAEFVVTAEDLWFRHGISPYLGERLMGRVVATYLRGEAVFERGAFARQTSGREVGMTTVLAAWNVVGAEEAAREVYPCCGCWGWARAVAAGRPFASLAALGAGADAAFSGLSREDWMEAFASHPRIGQTYAVATRRSLAWSAGEQSGVEDDGKMVLAEANSRYEERFGRKFIVCATGKTAGEMLEILERRMGNDAETEMMEAAEQQRQITHLRLRKWLEEG